MKKLLVLIALLLPFAATYSQREYLPTADDLELFAKTKTYIVMQDNPMSEYNFEIRDAIEKYWNITEYEFLPYDEFENKASDKNASFLYTATVNFEKDKSKTRYVFLCISLGGEYESLDELKDIVNIPLSYYGVDEDNYSYKLGTLVNFMQKHVALITENPDIISQNVFKYYNDNMADVQKKTLYLVEDELDRLIGSEARINAVYPYKFKIVSREEIKEAIMNKDEDIVFLHKVGPQGKKLSARVYKILIGAGDSHFYYFDYHKVNPKNPDALLMRDLKKLAKAKE